MGAYISEVCVPLQLCIYAVNAKTLGVLSLQRMVKIKFYKNKKDYLLKRLFRKFLYMDGGSV